MGSDALTSLSENALFWGALVVQGILLLLLFVRIQQGHQNRLATLVDKVPFLPGVVLIFLPFLIWMAVYAARGGPSRNALPTVGEPNQAVAVGEVSKAASARPAASGSSQVTPWEMALNPTGQQLEAGQRLVQEQNCVACHRIQGKGGEVASDLSNVGSRRSAEWIYRHFEDPQKMSPGTLMPKFRLSEQDLIALTAYVLTLKK